MPFFKNLFESYRAHLPHRKAVLSDHLGQLLLDAGVDLLAIHWVSYDTDGLISTSIDADVPFVLINHFDNTRLSRPTINAWVSSASGIGGVSAQCVPEHLRSRFFNLSDAVDVNFFDPARARRIHSPVNPIILLPARFDTGKGHQDLIEAAGILVAKNVNFGIVCAGAIHSIRVEKDLRSFAACTQVGARVQFLGEQSLEDLRDWYAACSVVVLPSHSEGLGRVLLEAQAMQKPVIAYDCSGMREAVLNNRTGFLVQKGDIDALASKISFLLSNSHERSRMGECGREFVTQNFSISALIRRHEKFYLEALSHAR